MKSEHILWGEDMTVEVKPSIIVNDGKFRLTLGGGNGFLTIILTEKQGQTLLSDLEKRLTQYA